MYILSASNKTFMPHFLQSAITKYGSADLEMLQEDPQLLARYVEVYTECIVPCYKEASQMYLQHKHLMDPDGVYEFPLIAMAAACGIDLKALTGGIWTDLFNAWVVFAQQYAQLTQRWRAGDYSIMQPAVPVNTTILVYIALVAMNTNIGRKEQELLGMSSASANAKMAQMLEERGES